MKFVNFFLSCSLAFQSFPHNVYAASNKANAKSSILSLAVKNYNKLTTLNSAIHPMMLTASKEDRAYLQSLSTKYGTKMLPKATLKSEKIYMSGSAATLAVNDSGFAINGKGIKLDGKLPIEEQLNIIKQALFPKLSLFNIVIPKAEADVGVGIAIFLAIAFYATMGNLNHLMCETKAPWGLGWYPGGCTFTSALWPIFMTINGLITFFYGSAGAAELPKKITCEKMEGGVAATFFTSDMRTIKVKVNEKGVVQTEPSKENIPAEILKELNVNIPELCADTPEAKKRLEQINQGLKVAGEQSDTATPAAPATTTR